MDKVLELCFRSIINYLDGNMELSKEYENLALERQYEKDCICMVEELIPRKVKRKLYKMVS